MQWFRDKIGMLSPNLWSPGLWNLIHGVPARWAAWLYSQSQSKYLNIWTLRDCHSSSSISCPLRDWDISCIRLSWKWKRLFRFRCICLPTCVFLELHFQNWFLLLWKQSDWRQWDLASLFNIIVANWIQNL